MTVEQSEKFIRDLDLWADRIGRAYEGADDLEGSDDLERVVRICTEDIRRSCIECRPGTLHDLAELKRGIRLAEILLLQIQTEEPARLKGRRYGAKPRNVVQAVYERIMRIVLQMTSSVLEIEERFPEMADEFDSERRAYREALEQALAAEHQH